MEFVLDQATLDDMSKKSKWAIISSLFLAFILFTMLCACVATIFPEWNLFNMQQIQQDVARETGRPMTLRLPRQRDYVGLTISILCIFPVYSFMRYAFMTQSALQDRSIKEYMKAQDHLTSAFRYIAILFLAGASAWGVMMVLAVTGVIK